MTEMLAGEVTIKTEGDIVAARRTVREIAMSLGFGQTDVTRIVTAASELARNVFKYGGGGMMKWRRAEAHGRVGVELSFIDRGPGIADVSLALQEGYSTGRGLGLGLPAAKRLMDELDIRSVVGEGTTITLRKWRAA
jgi:serine/threonine-protein kinase RsbT